MTVKSDKDDNAHEAKLVVLLPKDVCNIKVIKIDALTQSYKQCGGEIEFCLGSIDVGGTRSVEIQTDTCKAPAYNKQESFAAFVYSSTPDPCPLNNYRAWVNDSVPCYKDFNAAGLVKKGF